MILVMLMVTLLLWRWIHGVNGGEGKGEGGSDGGRGDVADVAMPDVESQVGKRYNLLQIKADQL